jgi:cell pole-organizing protein PopZ
MAKVSAAQEPSMEEILASIRRIISEDEASSAPVKSVEPEAPAGKLPSVAVSAADIDALFSARVHEIAALDPKGETQSVEASRPVELLRNEATRAEPVAAAAPTPPPAASAMVEPRMLRTTLPPIPEVRRPAPPVEKPVASPGPDPIVEAPLVSAATDSAVSAAFGNLIHAAQPSNTQTLDDLVKDMLRPMLKSWLDNNLPPLVERLVREEIERMSRRR